MRSKFAFLATVGAIVALAAPTSSMAAWFPKSVSFEITGDSHGPSLTTSLGSCSLASMAGTTPSTETLNLILSATVSPGACTSGASIATPGPFVLETTGPYTVVLRAPTESALALRYASLPGCKLTGPVLLGATWSNGYKPPEGAEYLKSVYHPDSTGTMTWRNDGASCALAGKTEAVRYEDTQPYSVAGYPSISAPGSAVVTDKTYPTYPVMIH
jgi:hypothetical protein